MSNPKIENEWKKWEADRQLDALDHEVLALGRVHREARRRNVGLPLFLYRLLRDQYQEAQTINRSLSDEERSLAIELLKVRNPDESTLDVLKSVIARRGQK